MTIFNPLYLSTISAVDAEGEVKSAADLIAAERDAEDKQGALVAAIVQCEGYEGAHQLTAFSKKRFGDPAESEAAMAMQLAWEANKAFIAEAYLSQAERNAITDYAAKMREMRQQYKEAYISELLKFDSALAAKRSASEFAARRLSSFMDKVRKGLEKHDAADKDDSETRTKRSKLAIKASHVYAILSSESKGDAVDCTGEEFDTLYEMLERWAKADKGAAVYLNKLGS